MPWFSTMIKEWFYIPAAVAKDLHAQALTLNFWLHFKPSIFFLRARPRSGLKYSLSPHPRLN